MRLETARNYHFHILRQLPCYILNMPIAVQNVDTLNDARYHYCMAAMTAGLMVARRETTTDIAALLVIPVVPIV